MFLNSSSFCVRSFLRNFANICLLGNHILWPFTLRYDPLLWPPGVTKSSGLYQCVFVCVHTYMCTISWTIGFKETENAGIGWTETQHPGDIIDNDQQRWQILNQWKYKSEFQNWSSQSCVYLFVNICRTKQIKSHQHKESGPYALACLSPCLFQHFRRTVNASHLMRSLQRPQITSASLNRPDVEWHADKRWQWKWDSLI